jgi:K+/H+ antiporter YhaU regulatory subunit KhtT
VNVKLTNALSLKRRKMTRVITDYNDKCGCSFTVTEEESELEPGIILTGMSRITNVEPCERHKELLQKLKDTGLYKERDSEGNGTPDGT